jgi:hypothetical protein
LRDGQPGFGAHDRLDVGVAEQFCAGTIGPDHLADIGRKYSQRVAGGETGTDLVHYGDIYERVVAGRHTHQSEFAGTRPGVKSSLIKETTANVHNLGRSGERNLAGWLT